MASITEIQRDNPTKLAEKRAALAEATLRNNNLSGNTFSAGGVAILQINQHLTRKAADNIIKQWVHAPEQQ